MRERSKVRKLLESLQAPFLVAAIAQVRANDKYLESFDQTVSYLRTFIIATDQVESRNVSSVQGEKNGKKRVRNEKGGQKGNKKQKNGKKAKNNGKDRFYKPEEWYAMSEEKRSEIMKLRKANKAQTSSVDTESEKEDSTQVSSTQTSQRR
jgi:hypothetical protein